MSRLILIFLQAITATTDIRYDNGRVQTIIELPSYEQGTLGKWYKNLRFCYKLDNKKMQVYQQTDVDIVLPAYSFIKHETTAQVLFCKFCKFFQPLA